MRSLKTAALLAVAAMTLAACGSGGDAAEGDGKVKLRFSYWGSDARQKLTEQVIAAFEKKNPTIDVVGEFSDWPSYYESLATKVAANDAPDVMTLEIRGLAEYGGRGALADLAGKVNVADLDQQVLSTGNFDGKQYAIPTGVNVMGMIVNKAALDKAGEELPDDKTWTWDDYIKLSEKITKAGDGSTFGTEYTFNQVYLSMFAAQRGEKFYNNGKIGITPETIKAWWANFDQLIKTKGSPDAAKMAEIAAAGVEQSLIGTNKGVFGMWWSNQLGTLSKVSGSELTLLRLPKAEGASSHGMFLQPAMHWTASSKTEHPAEAQKFIDYLVNDPEAAGILLSDRGLPINSKVLAAVKDKLPPADQQSLTFVDSIKSELATAEVPPKGGSKMEDIVRRYSEAVTSGQQSADEAATKLLEEANAAIAG
ncbi:extracellular solute-binding protein [Planomonospora venezuelensis]|uniref:Multiple sugar transport system substrate-binding protein n=1 Tax=Planomonospora venezuelensis TaxID=1999 RepID=A0A841DFC1_PLAVE|nr:extracellular solute-binding protein [Planomonospora venezuelensis]MBB5968179.1 multiple sugar transport system substrate-binding protein [Planomonospora venezuelensis]GIN05838.1 sugar ABC transporter substrate-binding protein [Planomonospora venezuelensis]